MLRSIGAEVQNCCARMGMTVKGGMFNVTAIVFFKLGGTVRGLCGKVRGFGIKVGNIAVEIGELLVTGSPMLVRSFTFKTWVINFKIN